jgi:hypothetical protein
MLRFLKMAYSMGGFVYCLYHGAMKKRPANVSHKALDMRRFKALIRIAASGFNWLVFKAVAFFTLPFKRLLDRLWEGHA